MWQQTRKALVLGLALAAATPLAAQQQDPAATPSTQGAAAVEAPAAAKPATEQVRLTDAHTPLDATLTRLTEMKEQVDLKTIEMQLLSAQAQIEQMSKSLGGVTTGTLDIPELLGVSGTPRKLVAEFNVGSSILHVTEGQWVTPEWKLARFFSNGVELVKKGGRETHTLLFGAGSTKDPFPGAQGAPFAGQPAYYPGQGAMAPPLPVPAAPQAMMPQNQ